MVIYRRTELQIYTVTILQFVSDSEQRQALLKLWVILNDSLLHVGLWPTAVGFVLWIPVPRPVCMFA